MNIAARQLSRPRGEQPLLLTIMRHYMEGSVQGDSKTTLVDILHPRRKMRAILEVIAPQVHQGDHETTVEILHTGSPESIAVELVRMFIYLETNDLTYRFSEITGCDVDLFTSADVMDFLRCMGFLTKENINWLGRRSGDPTSQVLLRQLLYHSIFDESSFDILSTLIPGHFGIDERVNPRESTFSTMFRDPYGFSPQTILQYSILVGNVNAVNLLLDLGADPYDAGDSACEFSALGCAASLDNHGRANIIVDLLLSKQASWSTKFPKDFIEVALQSAIRKANTALIAKLISERKRLGHEAICSQYLTLAAENGDCDTIRLLVDNVPRGEDGFITLPEDILFAAVRNGRLLSETMLEMFSYLLDLGADPTGLNPTFYGVRKCILCHILEGSSFEEDLALKLIEILRKHVCPPDRRQSILERYKQTPSLTVAVSKGYSRLVELFLNWGVDIDFCIEGFEPDTPAYQDCDHDDKAFDYVQVPSLLLTALLNHQTEMAKMLLRRDPKLTMHGGEQRLAMASADDTELVTMLLLAGSANLDGWEDFFEQAILRRNLKSIELLLSMSTDAHAAIGPTTILRAALTIGDDDKAYKQIAVCGYDSKALLEAVLKSLRVKEYYKVVEHILEARPNTPSDDFEVAAIAYAAIHHDMYLIGVLVKSFRQGPWVARFPDLSPYPQDIPVRSIFYDWERMHILMFVAHKERSNADAAIKLLLDAGVPANGMQLEQTSWLAAETWKQLIVAGAQPGPTEILLQLVGDNKSLGHIEIFCECKCPLDMDFFSNPSRTVVQAAAEFGSPEILQMLLHYGADVDGPPGFHGGATCLQLAAGSGNIGLVRLLLEKGASANGKRSLLKGRTAIEIAAENGRLDVLKLLLLQEQRLFDTDAERYQFVRAAKFAETEGHISIAQMLRQHIDWNSYDQRLFDGVQEVSNNYHLDEMTQKVLPSEKVDPEYWSKMSAACSDAGIDDIYDIDGIENWIGTRFGEPDEAATTTSDLSSDRKSGYMPDDINLPDTSPHQNARKDMTVQAGEDRTQIEVRSNLERPAQPTPVDDAIRDAMRYAENTTQGVPIEEQPRAAGQSQALSIAQELGGRVMALAPRPIRCKDNVPAWLDLAAQDRMLEVLQHRPATQNMSREPGIVLGEVINGMPRVGDIDDDFVDHNMAEDFVEGEQGQYFDWGFWDDQEVGMRQWLVETSAMRPC